MIMKFVTIVNTDYIVSSITDNEALSAMEVSSNLAWAKAYVQADNIGSLVDIKFGNAVFIERDLTSMEQGELALANTAMREAKVMAVAQIENDYMSKLLGK
jgi:hypothetical protein